MKRPAAPRKVAIKRLSHAGGLPLPAYQTAGAAGLDLVAAIGQGHPQILAPGAFTLVPTGLTIALPDGYEAQVRPRSGLAAKYGVTVLNSPGTIDADYRGEISVILINHGRKRFTINRGDRIAQLVIAPVARARLVESGDLPTTKRGSGGFGSTGHKGGPPAPKKNAIAVRPGRAKSATVKRVSAKKRASK